jgi:hypothetical protein
MINKKQWLIAGGALVVIALIGSIGAIAVHAQTPTPTPPSGWRGGPGNGPLAPRLGQPALDAAAQALGLTSADLSSELQSGKTLSAIAAEKGVDLKTVQDAIQTARNSQFRTQINQAVTDGKMSQDKADWLLEGLDKGYLNGPGFGFGFGFGGVKGPRNPAQGPSGQATPQP